MRYRNAGKTNLNMSVLSLGTWQLGGQYLQDGSQGGFPDIGKVSVIKLIHQCREELGINSIDTSPLYGNTESERRTGEALKGQRDKWVLSSKFGWYINEQGQSYRNVSPQHLIASVEASLTRLQTDYIDIVYFHVSPDFSHTEGYVQAVEALKNAGKIRYFGISTDHPQEVERLHAAGILDAVMFQHSLLLPATKMQQLISQHSLASAAIGVLMRGALSDAAFQSDAKPQHYTPLPQQLYHQWQKILPPGYSLTDFAIRYVVENPNVSTAVLGGQSFAQYQQAAHALTLSPLPEDASHITTTFYHQYRQWYDGPFKWKKIKRGVEYILGM